MSLIPYSSGGSSREIVLRHNEAIVVREATGRLDIRKDCPVCKQPIRKPSPSEQDTSRPSNTRQSSHDSFVSPEYFRYLRRLESAEEHAPSSPVRRLTQPAITTRSTENDGNGGAVFEEANGAATPPRQERYEGQGIRRDAMSPNYFTKFFREEKVLGKGGKGVVLLVRHELDGVSLGHFACKRVPVGDDHAWLEKVLVEVQLLQQLSHPNLVSYRHVWLEDAQTSTFGPSVPCAFILQQYCNSGDLLHYIIGDKPAEMDLKEQVRIRRQSRSQGDRPRDLKSSVRKLEFKEIYSFFKDITSGLAHLHAANYIHRDLKPSNCLLDRVSGSSASAGGEIRCLISDFGEVQPEHVVRSSTGSTGTISYCAPEVLRKDSSGSYANFTTKSDIFSLGMILYFMCFGRLPYTSSEVIQEEFRDADLLRAEISAWSGFGDERKERPDLPDQLYGFLKRLLAIDPVQRPSAEDILHAIRTESGLETQPHLPTGMGTRIAREGRTKAGGGGKMGPPSHLNIGKRIQPVDSPLLGTPELAPLASRTNTRPPRMATSEDERSRSGSRSRSTSRTPSPKNGLIPSPTKELPAINLHRASDAASLDGLRLRRDREGRDRSLPPQTPLLMAPPTTPLQNITHQIAVGWHYFHEWATAPYRVQLWGIRLAVFAFKIYTLTKPCLPLAARPWIAYPLLLLAALDFKAGMSTWLGYLPGSFLVHIGVLLWAQRLDLLCAERVPGEGAFVQL